MSTRYQEAYKELGIISTVTVTTTVTVLSSHMLVESKLFQWLYTLHISVVKWTN